MHFDHTCERCYVLNDPDASRKTQRQDSSQGLSQGPQVWVECSTGKFFI